MTPRASQGAQEGLEGNAQGYFAVYDGHCGSEAVQFVRDRLHTMVGEQSCFWKVRDFDHNLLLEAIICKSGERLQMETLFVVMENEVMGKMAPKVSLRFGLS